MYACADFVPPLLKDLTQFVVLVVGEVGIFLLAVETRQFSEGVSKDIDVEAAFFASCDLTQFGLAEVFE